ncbi:flavin monoamine oxidase family protein [Micromonospora maris]|uniref:Amine oxidase n=2 Tax=Micromonospora TaxID=1873 RepID=A0A9X0HZM8_9ACTN|nr:NAD(P)/FAD-dependent oxidoreductase [Micromonospora maris]AEB44515.1 amine oxidase [Micromonospora maris AB-18-032]AIS85769.1 amine oxidase [Verrucosispora sp. MS100047]KUJ44026.1 amine oxidase [Micromonospora maris]
MSNTTLSGRPLTRRGVLTAVTAAAAAHTILRPSQASATRRRHAYDVIVVGAGFAGITAARDLRRKGLRVLILEARNRIGGRTWTSTFQGEQVEMGGVWVDPMQTHVWQEIEDQGIGLVADPAADRTLFPTATGFGYFSPEEAFGRQGELLTQFCEQAPQVFSDPTDPMAQADVLRLVDSYSIRDRLNAMGLSTLDEKWLSGATGGLGGGSDRGAYTQFLHWWALCNYNAEQYYGINTYRPAGGMTGLAQAILTEAAADLRLNSPVRSITDNGREVTVRTRAGMSYTASSVVVAVPVNVWNTIDFAPGLSLQRRRASSETFGVPGAQKLWLRLRTSLGNTYVHTPDGYPVDTLVPIKQFADSQLMVGFSNDRRLNVNNVAQVERAVRLVVPDARVLAVKGQNWGADPYARGGWSFRRPGQLTGLLDAIQRPQGRISFATSDIASGWSGYVEGAIESGLRAAEQVTHYAFR